MPKKASVNYVLTFLVLIKCPIIIQTNKSNQAQFYTKLIFFVGHLIMLATIFVFSC